MPNLALGANIFDSVSPTAMICAILFLSSVDTSLLCFACSVSIHSDNLAAILAASVTSRSRKKCEIRRVHDFRVMHLLPL